ncbi:MAG: thioesterase family protein [Bacteroidota bacterium]
MYTAETTFRVRYSETDQMQYVYHGNYLSYYEIGRIEALRKLGLSYKALEASGIGMPVLESHSFYHKPGKYDDLITIKVTIPQLPMVKIKFEYELLNQDDELIHTGNSVLAFINLSTGKPVKAPASMLKALASFFDG